MDATITNLLEGVVAYDPLPPPRMPSQAPAVSTHAPSHSQPSSRTLTTSDLRPRKYYSPAMEAMRRQLSFEERKKQLLENARRYHKCLWANIVLIFPTKVVVVSLSAGGMSRSTAWT